MIYTKYKLIVSLPGPAYNTGEYNADCVAGLVLIIQFQMHKLIFINLRHNVWDFSPIMPISNNFYQFCLILNLGILGISKNWHKLGYFSPVTLYHDVYIVCFYFITIDLIASTWPEPHIQHNNKIIYYMTHNSCSYINTTLYF